MTDQLVSSRYSQETATRRHPLEHSPQEEPKAEGEATQFSLMRAPNASRWVLRRLSEPTAGQDEMIVEGFDLSGPINSCRTSATDDASRSTVRLGPDEWLLIDEPSSPLSDFKQEAGRAQSTGKNIAAAFTCSNHTLVEVSHRNVALNITGTSVRDVLNTGCLLDLDDRAFLVGMATRTLFAKAEIVLIRHDNKAGAAQFRIECWRSFATYVYDHLRDAAKRLGTI